MATKKADLQDDAGSESAENERAESDAAALFSMDDLRARLDAPLFHRDQGLSPSSQMPRLRELNFEPVTNGQTAEAPAPADAPVPVQEPAPAPAPEVAREPEPEPAPAPKPPPTRPTLVSFSEMLSATSTQPAPQLAAQPAPPEVQPQPEPQPEVQPAAQAQPSLLQRLPQLQSEPQPEPQPEPRPEPQSAAQPAPPTEQQDSPETPSLDASETEALLAVLAGFGSNPAAPNAPINGAPVALQSLVTETGPTLPGAQRSSGVEAELNRLAFLPDKEEPVGPVVVPVIAHTEQQPVIAVPQLSAHEMYTPRAVTVPSGKRVTFDTAFEGSKKTKRRGQKGVVRRLFSLILVLGLLGGGLYAAKYYLLDPKWDPAVRDLVKEVEEARHIEFDHALEVTSLTSDQYATQLANYSLGTNSSNQEQIAGELRALGLLSGTLDLHAIGLAALPESPAYYDAGDEQIYVVTGLPVETYRFAMHRALATALLDQKYGWGSRIKDAPPSVVRGTRALYEADALATASAMLTEPARALVLEQRLGLFTTYSVLTTPSQFGTAVASHLGVSLRGFIESVPLSDRDAVLKGAKITDSQALDLRRLVSGVADSALQQEVLQQEVLQDGARSQGMLFWYHALASRLDSATAWNTALAIQLDDVVVTPGTAGYCVAALLTVNPAALDGVNSAFLAWAAAAPFEAATTVVASVVEDIARVAVNACDPGVGVATNNGLAPLTMGGAPLRSEQYRLALALQPTLLRAQVACAVYFGDNVTASDERLLVDPVEGYLAPAAHAAPDPNRSECAAV